MEGTSFRRFQSKVVIVTGAGQGIGRAIAGAFAAEGAAVVVADRDESAARRAAEELHSAKIPASGLSVDVADPSSVDTLVDATLERHGGIHVLVNNAAVFSTIKMKPFNEISFDEWNSVLSVNLTGTFLCSQRVAREMQAAGSGGSIVNISSATVLNGRPFYLHYVASKAGVVGLTRALAREVGEFGVTVNAILPGSVDTGIPRDSVTPEQADAIVAQQAVHHRLCPDDIVGAALFLASDQARMISGQSLVVDGGCNYV